MSERPRAAPSPRAALLAFVVATLAAAAPACCPRPWPKTLTPLPDAAAVIKATAAPRAKIRSISGGAKVDTFTPQGRARVREVVVAERSGRLRFETLSPFEQPLSTLVSDGKKFALYDLGKKRYYSGPATPANISRLLPIRMRGEEIAQLLLGEAPLIAPTATKTELDKCKSHYRLFFEAKELDARQIVLIDAQRLVPLKSTLHVGGRLESEITFEDHKSVSGVLIPHKIRYVAPADKVDLVVLYTDVTLDETFDDDTFKLDAPRGVEVIPLD